MIPWVSSVKIFAFPESDFIVFQGGAVWRSNAITDIFGLIERNPLDLSWAAKARIHPDVKNVYEVDVNLIYKR